MVVDKDQGRAYDIRNNQHVERLKQSDSVLDGGLFRENIQSSKTTIIRSKTSASLSPRSLKKKASGWSSWWQRKKASDEALLLAVE